MRPATLVITRITSIETARRPIYRYSNWIHLLIRSLITRVASDVYTKQPARSRSRYNKTKTAQIPSIIELCSEDRLLCIVLQAPRAARALSYPSSTIYQLTEKSVLALERAQWHKVRMFRMFHSNVSGNTTH